MTIRSSKASMPFPELVTGDARSRYRLYDTLRMPWLPTNGMTDKQGRRLFTPFHPHYRYVVLHELAHVKWSPERMPRLDFDPRVFQAVEDARINMGLASLGKRLELPGSDLRVVRALADADLSRDDVGAVALRAIAGLGTNAEDDVVGVMEEAGSAHVTLVSGLVRRVRARLDAGRARRRAPVASSRLAVQVAREVAATLASAGLLPQGEPGQLAIGCVFGRCAHDESLEGLPGLPDSFLDPRADDPGVPSGELSIREPSLVVRTRRVTHLGAREWRRSEEGCVLRYPHRMAIDGAVFRRAARCRGGSVLVDTSGSMHLEQGDVSRIVEAAGSILVALYAGEGSAGELRIVARDGRRASDADLFLPGSGNIVDLPCLEWLAVQRRPRIWVSDGRVTGVGDRGSPVLRQRAEELCRRARIQRVGDLGEAEKQLRCAR
jgi:hypothetical protein